MAEEWVEITPEEYVAINNQQQAGLAEMQKQQAAQDVLGGSSSTGGALLNGILHGGSLGFGDEGAAGVSTGIDALKSLVTGQAGLSDIYNQAGGIYDEYLNQNRNTKKAYSELHPYASLGGQIVGAAPSMLVGGPIKTIAGRLLQAAGIGGLLGFGEGEGSTLDRAKSAGIGAGLGLVGGAGGEVLSTGLARIIPRASKLASSETGAVSLGAGREITPGEARVLQDLNSSGVTPDALESGYAKLADALQSETPLGIADVIPATKLDVKYLATRPDTQEIAEQLISDRAGGAADRLTKLFDEISPIRDPEAAGLRVQKALTDATKEATKARASAAKPFYDQAWESGVIKPSEALNQVLDEPMIQQNINAVKKTLKEYADLPDNHPKILHEVKLRLDDAYEGAGKAYEKRKVAILKDKLDTVLNKVPGYKEGRGAYREESAALDSVMNHFDGNKQIQGVAESLLRIQPHNADTVGGRLMKLSPNNIGKIKEFLGPDRQDAMEAGIRGYLQNLVDRGDERVALKLFRGRDRERMVEALGEDLTKKLEKTVKNEKLIAINNTKFSNYSPTQPFQEIAAREQNKLAKVLIGAKDIAAHPINSANAGWEKLVNAMTARDPTLLEQKRQGALSLYLDPQGGLDFLERHLPQLLEAAKRRQGFNALRAGTGSAVDSLAAPGAVQYFTGEK